MVELFRSLQENSIYYVVPASVNSIHHLGIYRARNLAVEMAIEGLLRTLQALKITPSEVVVDGKMAIPKQIMEVPVRQQFHADETIYEVSAASIVARVMANCLFDGYQRNWPEYITMGEDHGSLSEAHKQALRDHGPSSVHRQGDYGKGWWDKIMKGGA